MAGSVDLSNSSMGLSFSTTRVGVLMIEARVGVGVDGLLGSVDRTHPELLQQKYGIYLIVPLWKFRHVGGRRESSMPSGVSTPPSAIAAGERPGIAQARPSTLLVGVTSRFGRRGRLIEPRYKLFWQTTAIAASMLIFASLRPRPLTIDVTASDTTRSTMFASSPKVLRPTVSGKRSQQIGLSKMAGMRMRQSDSSMAKDSTNHFNLHAKGIAIAQKSDLTRSGQR
jgi:hypothetical protein